MSEARLASGMLVGALIRRIEAEGGHGMVLAKGDPGAGAVLLVLADRGVPSGVVERMPSLDGGHRWEAGGAPDVTAPGAVTDYLARRRRSDPDLWAVELDHPDAEAIARALLAD